VSLSLLFILEFFISLLQAYIFVVLIQLYIEESIS
jgi:F0F1-type ATP synthase membrane subunit a